MVYEERDPLVLHESSDAFSDTSNAVVKRVTTLPVLHVHVSTVAN